MHTSVDSAVPSVDSDFKIDDPITLEWSSEFLMTILRHWSVMVASMLLWLCAVFLLVSGASVGLGITSVIGSVVLMGLCFFSNWNAPEEDFTFNVDGLEEHHDWPYPDTEEPVDPREALSVIDNRGGGDCLFLSVARGLIHLIQQEPTDNRQLLARWRALDPLVSEDIARHIEEFDVSTEDAQLLDFLQNSLRKIYIDKRKEELRALVTAPYTTLVSDFHFREFQRCIQIARREVQGDRVRDGHNTFLDFIRPFRKGEMKNRRPDRLSTPEVLFKRMIQSNNKLFMGCIEKMQDHGRWAGDDQILVLGRAFNIATEIMQAEDHAQEFVRRELVEGQPLEGQPLLSVMNFSGTHWMTKIVRDTVAPTLEASSFVM